MARRWPVQGPRWPRLGSLDACLNDRVWRMGISMPEGDLQWN